MGKFAIVTTIETCFSHALRSGLGHFQRFDDVRPESAYPPIATTERTSRLTRDMSLNVTVHGFRSTFRDWAGNETHVDRVRCELALGHRAGDATELAYRRGDALEKRRALMDAWSEFCG
jgi:integrase